MLIISGPRGLISGLGGWSSGCSTATGARALLHMFFRLGEPVGEDFRSGVNRPASRLDRLRLRHHRLPQLTPRPEKR
jgi:hypothetical protein